MIVKSIFSLQCVCGGHYLTPVLLKAGAFGV